MQAPRYNVAPGTDVVAVTTDRDGVRRGELLRWGLVPAWAKDPADGYKMINARAETLEQRPAYRPALERYRCLIPADGFYEWQSRPGRAKQPFHISRTDHKVFAFAGLWSVWHRGAPDEVRSCTIITTQAHGELESIHARTPVILTVAQEPEWIDHRTPAGRLRELVAGISSELLSARPVSTAVNDATFDGPECLHEPNSLPDAPDQGQLFT